jgi:hypothetical protein
LLQAVSDKIIAVVIVIGIIFLFICLFLHNSFNYIDGKNMKMLQPFTSLY